MAWHIGCGSIVATMGSGGLCVHHSVLRGTPFYVGPEDITHNLSVKESTGYSFIDVKGPFSPLPTPSVKIRMASAYETIVPGLIHPGKPLKDGFVGGKFETPLVRPTYWHCVCGFKATIPLAVGHGLNEIFRCLRCGRPMARTEDTGPFPEPEKRRIMRSGRKHNE